MTMGFLLYRDSGHSVGDRYPGLFHHIITTEDRTLEYAPFLAQSLYNGPLYMTRRSGNSRTYHWDVVQGSSSCKQARFMSQWPFTGSLMNSFAPPGQGCNRCVEWETKAIRRARLGQIQRHWHCCTVCSLQCRALRRPLASPA